MPSLDRDRVLELGREAGFTAVGIAHCGPSDHGAALARWLARGAHAGMEWMKSSEGVRRDLRSKWPWARSALVGAVSYLTAPRDRQELPGVARYVARYARGFDYHELLKRRFLNWAGAVEQAAGRRVHRAILVDTSTILEREMAVRAGLGWFGKNTCLIGPRGDSWRFLGVTLLEIELEPTVDPAAALHRCGSCRACLDACPTGAITEPFFVDARRCLSYLNIEHEGALPVLPGRGVRDTLDDWLFGCDVCQDVCPWNHKVEPADAPEFAPDPRWAGIPLAEVVRMDIEGFKRAFFGTPLSRPKRAGIVRNALHVAAHVGDDAALAAAHDLVDDADAGVRAAARAVLGPRGAR